MEYPVYRANKTIQHHECGVGAVLKLKDLLDYLQDLAGHHADELGVGLGELSRHKMLWVVSRLKVAVEVAPKVDDEILVETYPSGTDLLFAVRQYKMTRPDGTVLIRGTSYWLLLDADNFRPLKPLEHLPPIIRDTQDAPRHFTELSKIMKVPVATRRAYHVGYSDIDENGHLNNAVYGRYIYDVLGDIMNEPPHFREFQINYNHQVLLGDVLHCGGSRQDDGRIYIDGVSEDGKVNYFQASVLV